MFAITSGATFIDFAKKTIAMGLVQRAGDNTVRAIYASWLKVGVLAEAITPSIRDNRERSKRTV